ncbi:hypothetical protein [Paenibacillus qinlingensis]|uniref:Uncharacterized protein n=1 Tax=Paenibacillus qinlingensis TaxID=1837343 RepID=A0ABU1P6R5_9BACL|nr:hypothetical protein [Paenibacillus qinlingensis]MDR6555447.1 hypothetical protein [Paenibacillus qinlingensis]
MINQPQQVSNVMSNFAGTVSGRPRKIYAGTAVTDGAGIATFYVTQDGTSTGVPFMSTIEGFWSSTLSTAGVVNVADVINYDIGSNFVRARSRQFNGALVILGLSVLAVPTFATGVTISFLVWGD